MPPRSSRPSMVDAVRTGTDQHTRTKEHGRKRRPPSPSPEPGRAPFARPVDANFTKPTAAAIKAATYYGAVKLAWESRRFWEQDDMIYGGLAFTDQPNALIWYPSGDFGEQTGILIGAYSTGAAGTKIYDAMSLAQRAEVSRAVIERMHPGRGKELRNPVTVSWGRTPFTEGIRRFVAEYERARVGEQVGDPRLLIRARYEASRAA